MHARLHIGQIALPFAHLGAVLVKGVGIGIKENVAGLARDDAGNQLLQGGILLHQRQVGINLGRAVALPHRVDVAGDDVGVGLAVHRLKIDGGIQRIGETIPEHPCQFPVADGRLNLLNRSFHGHTLEFALGFRNAHHGKSGFRGRSALGQHQAGRGQRRRLQKVSAVHRHQLSLRKAKA